MPKLGAPKWPDTLVCHSMSILGNIISIMANRVEKKMEHEMETVATWQF